MTTPFTLTEEQLSAVYADVVSSIERLDVEIREWGEVGNTSICEKRKRMRSLRIDALRAMGYPYAIPN